MKAEKNFFPAMYFPHLQSQWAPLLTALQKRKQVVSFEEVVCISPLINKCVPSIEHINPTILSKVNAAVLETCFHRHIDLCRSAPPIAVNSRSPCFCLQELAPSSRRSLSFVRKQVTQGRNESRYGDWIECLSPPPFGWVGFSWETGSLPSILEPKLEFVELQK